MKWCPDCIMTSTLNSRSVKAPSGGETSSENSDIIFFSRTKNQKVSTFYTQIIAMLKRVLVFATPCILDSKHHGIIDHANIAMQ